MNRTRCRQAQGACAGILIGAMWATSAFAGDNLLVNGDFEKGPATGVYITLATGSTALTGWTVTQTSIDLVGTGWQHYSGVRSLDLDGSPGPGGVQQTFATSPGQWYEVTFAMAGNANCGATVHAMSVSAAGQSATFSFNVAGHSNANMGWQVMSWCFKSASATSETTITFNSLSPTADNCGPALDDVIVILGTGPLTGDINCDGLVNVTDLLGVITAWGPCPGPPWGCPADINNSDVVDVNDLLLVITNWS